jgi:thiol-disulfide isomerase/thioredoxin
MQVPERSTDPGTATRPASRRPVTIALAAFGTLLVLGLFLQATGVGAPSKTARAPASPPPVPARDGPEQAEARLLSETAFFHPVNVLAPDVSVAGADGKELKLSSLRGKVVFVNFWATWCPPCTQEMPSMLKLGRELTSAHPRDFVMLAVSTDDAWDRVRDYFSKEFGGMPQELSVVHDPGARAARAYYCTARGYCPDVKFPESYIVGRDGRILAMMVGPRDWSDPAARQLLEAFISG